MPEIISDRSHILKLWLIAAAFVWLTASTGLAQTNRTTFDPIDIKCGTERHVDGKWHLIAPQDLPTGLTDSIVSDHFVIHFDLVSDDTDSVTTIDYARQADRDAEDAFWYETDTLGYPVPAATENGRYHIFLTPKPYGAYGATVPVAGGLLSRSPSGLPRSLSYIICDNKFTDVIYATKGYDALRITIFHEFFHIIQFADYAFNTQYYPYFNEISSVWMEMQSNPSIRDYQFILPKYLNSLDLSFDKSPTSGYGQGIFFSFLAKEYGPVVVRDMWESYANQFSDPVTAMESVLEKRGSSFCKEYMHFGAELFKTGRRFEGSSLLPDAQLLPSDELKINWMNPGEPVQLTTFAMSLQYVGAGFGSDSCVAIIARDTNRAIAVVDTVSLPQAGVSIVHSDAPLAECDTTACSMPLSSESPNLTVFPNPYHPSSGPLYLVTGAGSRTASCFVTIFNTRFDIVYEADLKPLGFGGEWVVSWNGKDALGRDLPSGEYIFSMNTDGAKTDGKFVMVR